MPHTKHILPTLFSPGGAGAVVAYARGAGAPTVERYGYADVASKKRLSPSSLFDLASLSKSFTGAAVALLYERGALEPDAPLNVYFPSFGEAQKPRPVTLQDLLWHTSGLPDYLGHFSEGHLAALTNDDVVAFAGERLPDCRPGLNHEYSNTNYALLATVIEKVSGRSYATFLREEVFVPLSLPDTYVLEPGWHNDERVSGYVNTRLGGVRLSENELDMQVLGDGGVFSTAGDLVGWFQTLAKGGLLRKGASTMLAPGRLDDGAPVGYGWGVVLEGEEGGRWFGHNGSWYGASTFAGHAEKTDVTFALLSNEVNVPVTRIWHAYQRYLSSA